MLCLPWPTAKRAFTFAAEGDGGAVGHGGGDARGRSEWHDEGDPDPLASNSQCVEPALHERPAHHHPAARDVHVLQPADRRRAIVRSGQGSGEHRIKCTARALKPVSVSSTCHY